MAYEGTHGNTTVTALGDLDSYQYHAISLSDGLRAANGVQASGIIKNKPKSGEAATVTFKGESFFFAGGAVTTPGYPLTVNASATFVAATSGDTQVGIAKAAVSSGAIGTGIFDFANKGNYAGT